MILNLSASLKTDTSQSLSLAHPLFPHRLLILLIDQVFGTPAFSAALALLVVGYPIAREPNPADCKRRNWFTAARSIGMVNSTTPVDGRPGKPIRSLVARWRRRPSESHVYYLHNWRKIGCHGNVPRGIEKGTSDYLSTLHSQVLPSLQVRWRSVWWILR